MRKSCWIFAQCRNILLQFSLPVILVSGWSCAALAQSTNSIGDATEHIDDAADDGAEVEVVSSQAPTTSRAVPAAHQQSSSGDAGAAPTGPSQSGAGNNQSRGANNSRGSAAGGASGDIQLRGGNESRRSSTPGAASSTLLGSEAAGRASQDLGAFIGENSAGTTLQRRNPVNTDLRVRGNHVGQVVASGSFWTPGRYDLDTLLSKIDSRSIQDVVVVKGPYASTYGPGHSFVDFVLLPAPRYPDGRESHGSTSFDFRDNGRRFYGRQSLETGNTNWGARVAYSHRTGNDYRTGDNSGNGFDVLGSHNSRDLIFASGYDLTPTQHLDFHLLRLDQTSVDFPGLAWNIDWLKTDGYELRYVDEAPLWADYYEAEVWYNRTVFAGSGNGNWTDGAGNALPIQTDVDASSAGYRFRNAWGEVEDSGRLTLGTDLIYLTTALNDFDLISDTNFPIPNSYSADVGFFVEQERAITDRLRTKVGARFDNIATHALDRAPQVPAGFISGPSGLNSALDQEFNLWSTFLSSAYEVDSNHQLRFGVGHGQRPPMLTEMYANLSFMGVLQSGLTTLQGDPQLDPERRTQIDLGLDFDYSATRGSINGHYAWIRDYITWDALGVPTPTITGAITPVNTDTAIMSGIDANIEHDLSPFVSVFGTCSYVQGDDLTRNSPARSRTFGDRSGVTLPREALPGISPLDSRLGLRWHDNSVNPNWNLMFSARVVDDQQRVAASLGEIATPGFTTFHINASVRLRESWNVLLGVDNVGDKFYREHLDYRTLPHPLFQPGRTYYIGTEFVY